MSLVPWLHSPALMNACPAKGRPPHDPWRALATLQASPLEWCKLAARFDTLDPDAMRRLQQPLLHRHSRQESL